ncbi:MAG: efflux RND transporter periplasmic adaptor subunit, partial [Plesiomonas shigelloides]
MKLRIALPLITLTLLLQGCKPDAEAPQVPVSRPVKLYTIATETHNTATLPGRLEAGQRAELAFEVAGRLVQLPAQEGQAIKAGQVLAQLDNRDFASKVRSADAEYQRAHADYQRGQTLFNGKQAISRAELEKLRTQSAVAKSALEQARKALRDTQITAPFNGIVSRVLVNNHENINAKQPVVIVQDVSYFEIRLHVTERNLLERHDRNTPLF